MLTVNPAGALGIAPTGRLGLSFALPGEPVPGAGSSFAVMRREVTGTCLIASSHAALPVRMFQPSVFAACKITTAVMRSDAHKGAQRSSLITLYSITR